MLIDVDTGVDDSLALLYALHNPEVEIVGITTSCGNVDAVQAAENTLRIIELSGTTDDIPVVIGANKPLVGEWDGPVHVIHGDNGVGNVQLPETDRKPVDTDVLAFINRMAEKYAGELVLITLGRLTNIAQATQKYPAIVKNIKRMVMMGGTVQAPGNVTPVAEANVEGDPEACDKVFQSGMDITVVGLDVTQKTLLKREYIEQLEKFCTEKCEPSVTYIKQALEHYWTGNRLMNYYLDECPLHDPLAMVVAVTPDVVQLHKRKARVECKGEFCRGMIVTDMREQGFDAEYISFAMLVDDKRALKELMSVFWKETVNETQGG